jgi:hypothetical protein
MSAADHTPVPLSPERLAEIESLLQCESSISFHSAQARESMLLVVAEVARLTKRVAELEQFEIMSSRRCERGVHADWLVDSENTHQCPWCRIAELEAEVAHARMDIPERLVEIEGRITAKHLTTGPWRLEYECCDCGGGYACGHGRYVTAVVTPEPDQWAVEYAERHGEPLPFYAYHRSEMAAFSEDDWELMAHARTDIPDLLAEVKRQAAELEHLRKDRDAFRDQRNAVFKTNERLLAEVSEADQARLQAENEMRTVARSLEAVLQTHRDDDRAEIERLRAQLPRLAEQSDLWQRGNLDTATAMVGVHSELHGHQLPVPGEWDRERNAELVKLRAQVAELEAAAYGNATVRIFSPVVQIRHLHAAVAAQMSRANTLDRLCRQQRERAEGTRERQGESDMTDMTRTAVGPTGGQLAENEIINWIRQHPRVGVGDAHWDVADLRGIALNPDDEFEYGDDALAQWMEALCYGTTKLSLTFAERNSLADLRGRMETEDFWDIDWSVVRAAILPPEEEGGRGRE